MIVLWLAALVILARPDAVVLSVQFLNPVHDCTGASDGFEDGLMSFIAPTGCFPIGATLSANGSCGSTFHLYRGQSCQDPRIEEVTIGICDGDERFDCIHIPENELILKRRSFLVKGTGDVSPVCALTDVDIDQDFIRLNHCFRTSSTTSLKRLVINSTAYRNVYYGNADCDDRGVSGQDEHLADASCISAFGFREEIIAAGSLLESSRTLSPTATPSSSPERSSASSCGPRHGLAALGLIGLWLVSMINCV